MSAIRLIILTVAVLSLGSLGLVAAQTSPTLDDRVAALETPCERPRGHTRTRSHSGAHNRPTARYSDTDGNT